MNKEFTRMQKLAGIITEGYQGSPYGSSEDMALDMVKTGAGLPGGLPEVSSNKMTVKEFKNKIKEAILAEKALKEDADLDIEDDAKEAEDEMGSLDETSYEGMERMDGLVNQNDIRAFLSIADKIMMELHKEGFDYDDIINYLSELLIDPPAGSISEAKKKKEDDETSEEGDIDIDLGTDGENIDLNLDGEEGMDDTQVDMNMDTAGDIDAGSSESKKAFSELTDAYRAAKELGDEKLIRQIANTITYFNKNIILSQG